MAVVEGTGGGGGSFDVESEEDEKRRHILEAQFDAFVDEGVDGQLDDAEKFVG